MFRKVTSLILTAMMLFLLGSPVLAASAAESTPPTVDEILNEYHERCDAVRKANATRSDAAAMSLTTADQQLASIKADTIATLNAAGYEAYDVNPNTFSLIQDELDTNLSEIGILPNESYLVVVSGDPNENSAGSRSYGDAGGAFNFTYNGVTHLMRFVTVTPSHNSRYHASDVATLISASSTSARYETILNALLGNVLTGISETLGTFASICGINFVDINISQNNSLAIQTDVYWNRIYTQIYKEDADLWMSWSSVDYARVINRLFGSLYDNSTNSVKSINEQITDYYYSDHFSDFTWRKQMAARGWYYGTTYHEYVGDITICYYKNSSLSSKTNIFYFAQYEGTAP